MHKKRGLKMEKSKQAPAKRLHSDEDSEENLEDNTTKDQGRA